MRRNVFLYVKQLRLRYRGGAVKQNNPHCFYFHFLPVELSGKQGYCSDPQLSGELGRYFLLLPSKYRSQDQILC